MIMRDKLFIFSTLGLVMAIAAAASYANLAASAITADNQAQLSCTSQEPGCPGGSCCSAAAGQSSCCPDDECCPTGACCVTASGQTAKADCCPDGGCCPECPGCDLCAAM